MSTFINILKWTGSTSGDDYVCLQGKHNFFKLCPGTKPSFGIIHMKKSDYDTIIAESDQIGTLSFEMPIAPTYEIDFPYMSIIRVKTSGNDINTDDIAEVTVADPRYHWQKILGDADYNTYQQDLSLSTDIIFGDPLLFENELDYELANLNGTDQWTFEEIIDALEVLLTAGMGHDVNIALGTDQRWPGTGTAGSPVAAADQIWKPRHILGKNIPVSQILAELLRQMHFYMVWDWAEDDAPDTEYFKLYPIGATAIATDKLGADVGAIAYRSSNVVIEHPETNQLPASVKMLAPKKAAESEDHYTVAASVAGIGGFGIERIPIPHAAFYSADGVLQNTLFLAALGELIGNVYKDSFGIIWKHMSYKRPVPLVPNSYVQEILWISNAQGARTEIKSYRPALEEYDLKPSIHTRDQFWAGTGGVGAQLVWGRVIETLKYISPDEGDYVGVAAYTVRITEPTGINMWTASATWTSGQQCLYDASAPTSTDNALIYEANAAIDHDEDPPPSNPKWVLVPEVTVDEAWGFLNITDFDLRDCIPWYNKGEDILLIRRVVEDEDTGESETKYYIAGGLVYCGDASNTSLRWNDFSTCASAVFS